MKTVRKLLNDCNRDDETHCLDCGKMERCNTTAFFNGSVSDENFITELCDECMAKRFVHLMEGHHLENPL